MAATFPGGVKSFTTKTDGVDKIYASHVNDLQDEVMAIETELRKTTGSVVSHGSLAGLSNNDHPQYLLSASTNYPRADGWIPVSATWTYASATTITVPSGATNIYSVGMGIRLTANSVVKQAYITKVENTLLTVAGDALTNYTFSAISYAPNPATAIGFPQWFNWTPTFTGWSSVNTYVARYCVVGKMVHFILGMSDGVSNATNAEITLPVGMKNNGVPAVNTVGIAFDNGILVSSTTRWQINHTAPTILEFRLNGSNNGWTASGTKRFFCEGFYEAE